MSTFIKKTVFLFICIVSSNCIANTKSDSTINCNNWLKNSIKVIESFPTQNRFRLSLLQVAKACEENIPAQLILAAKKSITLTLRQRQNILQQAAAPYFSEKCLAMNPEQAAENMLATCLSDEFIKNHYYTILHTIDVATYMFGIALEKEFNKANFNKFLSKKFFLNYYLSAALEYEANVKNK